MFLHQALGAATEVSRELVRSLIDGFILSGRYRHFMTSGGYLHGIIAAFNQVRKLSYLTLTNCGVCSLLYFFRAVSSTFLRT